MVQGLSPPSSADDGGSIPGEGSKIPHGAPTRRRATRPLAAIREKPL